MFLRISKPFLYVFAWVSFALGLLGLALPVIPGTPFFILSAYLFNKSSKRMHSWLTSLPHIGSAIIDWEKNRVIRPKAKVLAIVFIWASILATIVFSKIHFGLKIMLFFIATSVSVFILTRKSHAKNHSRKPISNQ